MRYLFSQDALEEYQDWLETDKKAYKRIKLLLKDIARNPYDGLGKPERLSGDKSEFYSRRINKKDRLVYKIEGDICEVYQCKNHYGDK